MDDRPSQRVVDGNKYIEFRDMSADFPDRKTEVWRVHSKSSNSHLGFVSWYGAWRQYCFMPARDTVFNVGCLDAINAFITRLMDERRDKKD